VSCMCFGCLLIPYLLRLSSNSIFCNLCIRIWTLLNNCIVIVSVWASGIQILSSMVWRGVMMWLPVIEVTPDNISRLRLGSSGMILVMTSFTVA
jgi:hypothetical protein